MGHDPLAAKIGQCHNGSPGGHQRQAGSCNGNQRIRTDVERHREPLPTGVDKLPGQLFAWCEGKRVDKKIVLAELFLNLLHQSRNLIVITHITGKGLGARQRSRQLFDILFQALILIVKE